MKKKKWCHFRHKIWFSLMRPIFKVLLKVKYNYKAKPFKVRKQNYLVISNHTCTLDPFLICASIKKPVYFIASDDIMKNGFVSRFIGHAVAPIPIRKGSMDIGCIKKSISVAKEGGTIGLFPEGNRTYSGELGNIDISLIKFIRMLKIPLLIYYIDGGYGMDPRWGKKSRYSSGAVGSVKKEISVEEISKLSDEELMKIIKENLSQNYNHNLTFKSKERAEYLERFLFVCPECNELETLYSNKNELKCAKCSMTLTYNNKLKFIKDNKEYRLPTVKDFSSFQKSFIKDLDLADRNILLSDANVKIIVSRKGKTKELLDAGKLRMMKDSFILEGKEERIFLFKNITSITNQGKHKFLFYIGDDYYQFIGDERFSSYKYYLMFNKLFGSMDKAL